MKWSKITFHEAFFLWTTCRCQLKLVFQVYICCHKIMSIRFLINPRFTPNLWSIGRRESTIQIRSCVLRGRCLSLVMIHYWNQVWTLSDEKTWRSLFLCKKKYQRVNNHFGSSIASISHGVKCHSSWAKIKSFSFALSKFPKFWAKSYFKPIMLR